MAQSRQATYGQRVWKVCIALSLVVIAVAVVQLVRAHYIDGGLYAIVGIGLLLQGIRGLRGAGARRPEVITADLDGRGK